MMYENLNHLNEGAFLDIAKKAADKVKNIYSAGKRWAINQIEDLKDLAAKIKDIKAKDREFQKSTSIYEAKMYCNYCLNCIREALINPDEDNIGLSKDKLENIEKSLEKIYKDLEEADKITQTEQFDPAPLYAGLTLHLISPLYFLFLFWNTQFHSRSGLAPVENIKREYSDLAKNFGESFQHLKDSIEDSVERCEDWLNTLNYRELMDVLTHLRNAAAELNRIDLSKQNNEGYNFFNEEDQRFVLEEAFRNLKESSAGRFRMNEQSFDKDDIIIPEPYDSYYEVDDYGLSTPVNDSDYAIGDKIDNYGVHVLAYLKAFRDYDGLVPNAILTDDPDFPVAELAGGRLYEVELPEDQDEDY